MTDETWITDVLHFWFAELTPKQWWTSDAALDATIRTRFLAVHERAASQAGTANIASAGSALATVIALDQFPRNMFRGTARAFATDPLALAVAERAISDGLDKALSAERRSFLYMPFMHAENRATQTRSIALFATLDDAEGLKAAHTHKAIVDRFGRYPHRNAVLGRATTADEQTYLDGKAERFGQ